MLSRHEIAKMAGHGANIVRDKDSVFVGRNC